MRLLREERGDERVGDRFERAVGQREDERALYRNMYAVACACPCGRGERDERREHVEQERRDDQLAVADLVDDDAADDDAEAEAGEAGAADGAELRAGEAEFRGPVGKDAAADAEADAGGENGHEAGPQQAPGVRRDAIVAQFVLVIVCRGKSPPAESLLHSARPLHRVGQQRLERLVVMDPLVVAQRDPDDARGRSAW